MKPGAGGVTLLCLLSSVLVVALTAYTLYLAWAGITTNESGKWDNTKLDIVDQVLFMRPLDERRARDTRVEPYVRWPSKPKVVAISREIIPTSDDRGLEGRGYGPWGVATSIHELENLYDIGFWRNLGDIFLPRSVLERWIPEY